MRLLLEFENKPYENVSVIAFVTAIYYVITIIRDYHYGEFHSRWFPLILPGIHYIYQLRIFDPFMSEQASILYKNHWLILSIINIIMNVICDNVLIGITMFFIKQTAGNCPGNFKEIYRYLFLLHYKPFWWHWIKNQVKDSWIRIWWQTNTVISNTIIIAIIVHFF